MARLIPQDKATHTIVGALVALAALLAGPEWAALACATAAVGREVYGWHARGWRPFDRADYIEAGLDIAFTLAGGAVVLLAAFIGLRT